MFYSDCHIKKLLVQPLTLTAEEETRSQENYHKLFY